MPDALVREEKETDYTLVGSSCWITVETLSVYIHKTDEGVVVDVYPKNEETEDPIGSTWVLFSEGEENGNAP